MSAVNDETLKRDCYRSDTCLVGPLQLLMPVAVPVKPASQPSSVALLQRSNNITCEMAKPYQFLYIPIHIHIKADQKEPRNPKQVGSWTIFSYEMIPLFFFWRVVGGGNLSLILILILICEFALSNEN